MLLVTHDPAAAEIADRVETLTDGRLGSQVHRAATR
jgi:ABC-type lipoprotein export system ATPase subunit